MNNNRRKVLKSLMTLPALGLVSTELTSGNKILNASHSAMMHQRLKSSLNGFSFNAPLMDGSMDIIDMLEFCAEVGFDGVDITGYYFKGYPLPLRGIISTPSKEKPMH